MVDIAGEIGYSLGWKVSSKVLPNVSTDPITVSNVEVFVPIKVKTQWEKLKEKEWELFYDKKHEMPEYKKLFNDNIKWYYKNILEVYLPEEVMYEVKDEIKQTINSLLDNNLKQEIINGIESALWETDGCHYNIDNIIKKDNNIYLKFNRSTL